MEEHAEEAGPETRAKHPSSCYGSIAAHGSIIVSSLISHIPTNSLLVSRHCFFEKGVLTEVVGYLRVGLFL